VIRSLGLVTVLFDRVLIGSYEKSWRSMGGCRVRIETTASWVTLGGCFCFSLSGWWRLRLSFSGTPATIPHLWIRLGRNRFVHSQEGQDDPGKRCWCFELQMVRSTFELNQPSARDQPARIFELFVPTTVSAVPTSNMT